MSTSYQCVKRLRHDFSDVTTTVPLLYSDDTDCLYDFIKENKSLASSRMEDEDVYLLSTAQAECLVEFLKEKNCSIRGLINAVEEKKSLDLIDNCPVHTSIMITFC